MGQALAQTQTRRLALTLLHWQRATARTAEIERASLIMSPASVVVTIAAAVGASAGVA
jgi:hypothetical protein